MSATSDVIESLTRSRHTLLETFAGLSNATLDQKGVVGEWSIKNVLAHVAAWEQTVTGFVPERLATGAKPAIFAQMTDEDTWNEKEVARHEHLTPQEQVQQLAAAREALLQLIRGLGDEALNRQHPWPEWKDTLAAYLLDSIGGHEQEHLEAMQAAVGRLRG
ncbi:MAG TPA: DinB family protein [Ktedonobacterales bacterium]|jgi:hypothetical protein